MDDQLYAVVDNSLWIKIERDGKEQDLELKFGYRFYRGLMVKYKNTNAIFKALKSNPLDALPEILAAAARVKDSVPVDEDEIMDWLDDKAGGLGGLNGLMIEVGKAMNAGMPKVEEGERNPTEAVVKKK